MAIDEVCERFNLGIDICNTLIDVLSIFSKELGSTEELTFSNLKTVFGIGNDSVDCSYILIKGLSKTILKFLVVFDFSI